MRYHAFTQVSTFLKFTKNNLQLTAVFVFNALYLVPIYFLIFP